jgi:hypothetical protein
MCEESEEVSIIKSVPNWISYLHQFSQIFLTFHLFFLHEKTDFGFIILENPLTRGGGAPVGLIFSLCMGPHVRNLLPPRDHAEAQQNHAAL